MPRSMSIPSDHREPRDLSRYPVRIAVLSDQREPKDLPFIRKKDFRPNEHRDDQNSDSVGWRRNLSPGCSHFFPCFLASLLPSLTTATVASPAHSSVAPWAPRFAAIRAGSPSARNTTWRGGRHRK